ncbi:MAG TPA: MarR family transcriptional regulator [Gemmatimonadaceae bacterium]
MKRPTPKTRSAAPGRSRSRTAPQPARPAASAAPRRSPTEETALKLWVVLTRAQDAVKAHVEADIAGLEITTTEFGILEALYHRGPLLLGDVQKKILVSSGGVTYLVDRLVAKGLVERQDCPGDRRARYAALTPAGRTFIGRIFPRHAQAILRAVSGLTKAEQLAATDLLRRLGHAASALPVAPAP